MSEINFVISSPSPEADDKTSPVKYNTSDKYQIKATQVTVLS